MTEYRPVQITPCQHCQQHLAVAVVSGMTTYCDPEPLSIAAEIAAIMTGRITYDVVPETSRKAYLHDRDIFRIRGGREYVVIAAHSCPTGMRPCMPWEIRKPPPAKAAAPRKETSDARVPF